MSERERAERRLGTVLRKKWTLERLVGVGGMASVYEATHKIGRKDAIKILHADIAEDDDLRERFEREALAVNRFQHPGKVEIRDIDVTREGEPFLVMELLEGETLRELVARDGELPLSKLLPIIEEVLDVLAAAHDVGVIHRDVKPDNVFLQAGGGVKLLDFGVAHIKESPALTKAGMRLGTTTYMAPEQVRGRSVDHRVDIFAVGATLFRLLAKRRIHETETEQELLLKMAEEPAPPIRTVAPDVPAALGAIIDRALRFSPEQRYASAREMQADLRAFQKGGAVDARPTPSSAPSTKRGGVPTKGSRPRLVIVDSSSSTARSSADLAERSTVPAVTEDAVDPDASTVPEPVPSPGLRASITLASPGEDATPTDGEASDAEPEWVVRVKGMKGGSVRTTLRSEDDVPSRTPPRRRGVAWVVWAVAGLVAAGFVAWLATR